MIHDVKSFLQQVVTKPYQHACFLNSLSYLEYCGFRKIVRSQTTQDMSAAVLAHAAEEARHALFFKTLAMQIGGEVFAVYRIDTLLAQQAVQAYFYHLDHHVAAACSQPQHVYAYVTWLIETRAMKVYGAYERVLKEHLPDVSLQPVLIDEAKHLHDVRQNLPKDGAAPDVLCSIEEMCFNTMWSALEAAIA